MKSKKIYIWGLLLIIIGGILFFLNYSECGSELKPVLLSWQMLVFVIGLIGLLKRYFFFGVFAMTVSAFFALPVLAQIYPNTLSCVEADFVRNYWAFLFVWAGVLTVLKSLCCKKCDPHKFPHHKCGKDRKSYCFNTNVDGYVERKMVFGGVEEVFGEPVFKGGFFTTVFGGISIDLRNTTLQEGETHIYIKNVFGGIVLLVPEQWYIESKTNNTFGGFSDSRIQNGEQDKSRKLIITGENIFGGCEIK
ncbi:MAG: cell wall-active antibiotics response protein [Bacteroidales bacterium]|jgi:predicted membrane protein|nr:cell wall-active antibiotics response protein [Bacteroidales bacterium]